MFFFRRVSTVSERLRTVPLASSTSATLLLHTFSIVLFSAPSESTNAASLRTVTERAPATAQRSITPKPKPSSVKPIPKSKLSTAALKKLKAKEPKIYLDPPKRPPTAFPLYCQKVLGTGVLNEYKGPGEKFTVAGKMWRQLSDTEKKPFVNEAVELYRQYDISWNLWMNSLTFPQIRAYNRNLSPNARRVTNNLVLPKEPLSAFVRFYLDVRNDLGFLEGIPTELKDRQVWAAKKAGERWRALTEDEKDTYRDIARREKAEFFSKFPKPIPKSLKPAR